MVDKSRGKRDTDDTARDKEQAAGIAENMERGQKRYYHGRYTYTGKGKRQKIIHLSEESGDDQIYETRRSKKIQIGKRRSRHIRRYSSSSTESSRESEKAHSKSKRVKSTENDSLAIFDKVLSIIKDVKSSDKSKMSCNNVIPDFDPMTKEQTVLTWITKVEECAEIYGWDEKETIHYSLPKLCGVAKSWYQGLPSLLHTWSEWKKKLIESFPCREDYAELLMEMLGKRVKYGESLEQYYYAKVNLLNRCKLNGRQAVDCLLHGVDDRAVRVGAQAAQFSEPESVLKFLRSVKVVNSRESNDNFRNNPFDRNFSSNIN